MCLGLFLTMVETTITATALISIGNYFNESLKVTWVVLSYLLTYMGFSLIFARMSDGIGRKWAVITAWVLFSGFSLASGLAQSMNQLIVFRAIEGIGGSGLYSMAMIILPQITAVRLWGVVSGLIGITFAFSAVFGPLLGGVITSHATWRWIYLFNAPAAVIAVPLFLAAWPKSPTYDSRRLGPNKIDIPGGVLLLVASALVVFAIQEAGSGRYKWNSPTIIVSLVVSGSSWCAFIGWIMWLESGQKLLSITPTISRSVVLKRPTGPAILTYSSFYRMCFLTGGPFFVATINLPIRFQIVNGDTPTMAGVRLLPMLAAAAFGGAIGGAISSKKNLTSYQLIGAACFMLVGSGLLSTVSNGPGISPALYGYQVLLGLGIGITLSSYTLLVALSNSYRNVASAQGAIVQTRVLGGSVGLAIASMLLNRDIAKELPGFLTPLQISDLQQSLYTLSNLDQLQKEKVAAVFASSFRTQMRVSAYFSAAAVVVGLFTWQRHPASVSENKARQAALANA
ncbi:hypothetical protein OIDMADRAFT_39623 [Oidiodendron maius Zn]|uniref:Major facilitator superfamily (MFS) profile domain-containing protein n=1 Tax=Oidiodendron maius (strain Zn) TaxID=913774 RepID=A0A0C3DTF1_OIDMZ|nr:hypothetical protein OIDMADRAFT_39623 [Oidiodendron maius Zn]